MLGPWISLGARLLGEGLKAVEKHNYYAGSEKARNDVDFLSRAGEVFQVNKDIIIDNANGLRWCRNTNAANGYFKTTLIDRFADRHHVNEGCITFDQASKFIDKMNKEAFAGVDTWRIPTLEDFSLLYKILISGNIKYSEYKHYLSNIGFDIYSDNMKVWAKNNSDRLNFRFDVNLYESRTESAIHTDDGFLWPVSSI